MSYFDKQAADDAELFFTKYLRHAKGEWAGRPFELEPWQREFVRKLYGTLRDEDGHRQYRTAFVEIPRKNGKSTMAAGVGLKGLFADNEPGAEVYSAAADRDQAAIVFELAKSMTAESPALDKRASIFKRSIVVPSTGSSYKVISADAGTKHGFNSSTTIIDELHAHRNGELYEVLTTAQGSRRQPITFVITTAGYDKRSICYQEYQYACKVRDGIVEDDSFLPMIFEAPPDSDWLDPETWAHSNPNLGVSLKLEYLQEKANKAKESPALQNAFRRLHLNQWTEQDVRWLDMGVWQENGAEVDETALEGMPCYGGLDLSSTTDLSALVLAFEVDNRIKLVCRFWCPEDTLVDRSRKDRAPVLTWASTGALSTTPGNVVDYDVIRSEINDLSRRFDIRELAIDRWNATQITTQLAGDGVTVVPFGQGYASMSAPAKELEAMLLARRIDHGGHPVLTWMASNVAVLQDPAGNIKPAKNRSADRIDGIVAACMALGRLTVNNSGGSVYADRGILVL